MADFGVALGGLVHLARGFLALPRRFVWSEYVTFLDPETDSFLETPGMPPGFVVFEPWFCWF